MLRHATQNWRHVLDRMRAKNKDSKTAVRHHPLPPPRKPYMSRTERPNPRGTCSGGSIHGFGYWLKSVRISREELQWLALRNHGLRSIIFVYSFKTSAHPRSGSFMAFDFCLNVS